MSGYDTTIPKQPTKVCVSKLVSDYATSRMTRNSPNHSSPENYLLLAKNIPPTEFFSDSRLESN